MIIKNLFVLFMLVVVLPASAQTVVKGETRVIDRLLNLNKIPALPVEDGSGRWYRLDDFIRRNRLYPGKPVLLVSWYYFCGGCKKLLDMLQSKGFGDQYNVVTLLIKISKNAKRDTLTLEEEIMYNNTDRDWSKYMNVITSDSLADKYFYGNDATPLFMYADKDLNVYHHTISLSTEMVDRTVHFMKQIELGKTKLTPGLRWYAGGGVPALPEDSSRRAYAQAYREGGYVYYKEEYKNGARITEMRSIERDGEYILDGIWKEYDANGKLAATMNFKEGAVTETFRRNHPNGKIAAILPVNGMAKMFDSTGRLTLQGPMKNGLGEGVFKEFKDGKQTTEFTLKAGVFNGLYKVYKEGEVEKTYYYQNGKLARQPEK